MDHGPVGDRVLAFPSLSILRSNRTAPIKERGVAAVSRRHGRKKASLAVFGSLKRYITLHVAYPLMSSARSVLTRIWSIRDKTANIAGAAYSTTREAV